ncbi:MAG: hypothetical protein AB1563_12685 [Bacillota bacterium]
MSGCAASKAASSYLEKLHIIQDPDHPEYEDSVEWLGESYDPEQFDPDLINERLRHLR